MKRLPRKRKKQVKKILARKTASKMAMCALSTEQRLEYYFKFFMLGGTLEKRSFYDEEGVEGWRFEIEDKEFFSLGLWCEIPDMPDELEDYLNKKDRGFFRHVS